MTIRTYIPVVYSAVPTSHGGGKSVFNQFICMYLYIISDYCLPVQEGELERGARLGVQIADVGLCRRVGAPERRGKVDVFPRPRHGLLVGDVMI